jgi:hypothetical protein
MEVVCESVKLIRTCRGSLSDVNSTESQAHL